MLLALLAVPVQAADAPARIAMRLLDHLDAGEYAAAEASFSTQMAAAVPADQLKLVWHSLPAPAGAAAGRGTPQASTQGDVTVVAVPLHYARAELLAKIVIDAEGRVAGFLIQPAPPPPAAPPAADARYVERDVRVGSGERALPATLTLPTHASVQAPVAAVVLVHGSGPNGRDEAIGANRPFLEIARGLAQHGIASLRYDKRTFARPQDFAGGDFDVDDETTDDAVAAVATLGAVAGVDATRVYVLGHSQGGMLAPRIAARSGQVAGLILLAAPARPLLDLLLEQNRYLLAADGVIEPAEQARLDELARMIVAIRSDAAGQATNTPLGLPSRYWREIEAIDPVADARATNLPMLLLQGGRDFQVVAADWQRWQEALAGERRVTLKRYPPLNHLGIAGEGPGTLAEYHQPAHVDGGLIADVARWIESHPCAKATGCPAGGGAPSTGKSP
jgi:alpha-beta hydrolase superfamily lysophospholipase